MNTGDLIFRWVATSKLPGCPNPEPQLWAVHRPIDHHRSSPAATDVRFEPNPTSETLISSRPAVAPPSHKSEKPHTAPSSLWWSEETAPEEVQAWRNRHRPRSPITGEIQHKIRHETLSPYMTDTRTPTVPP